MVLCIKLLRSFCVFPEKEWRFLQLHQSILFHYYLATMLLYLLVTYIYKKSFVCIQSQLFSIFCEFVFFFFFFECCQTTEFQFGFHDLDNKISTSRQYNYYLSEAACIFEIQAIKK